MENDFILTLTRDKYPSTVIRIFEQKENEPWCEACTAKWLRRRTKAIGAIASKSLFDDAKGHMFRRNVNDHGEEVWEAAQKDKGKNRFENMKAEFKLSGDSTYIAHGGWKKKDFKVMSKNQPTLKLKVKCGERKIGEDGVGFFELLNEVKKHQAIASIGVGNELSWSHALGVDYRQGNAVYFDSQLGELEFQDQHEIAYWWIDCWEEWEKNHFEKKSAFSVFPFKATAWASAWVKNSAL